MQFSQDFTVPFARPLVWAAFQDLETIATCMPGAQLTTPPRDGHLVGQVSIKLGPIAASFAGEGDVRFDAAAFAGEITGGGTDRKSSTRAKGTARFALTEEAGSVTRVRVDVDYQLAGALAQFSRANIVQDLAARLTQSFADNLKTKLASAAAAAPVPEVPAAAPPSLDLGAMLWTMLRGWLRRLFVRA
jgi:uncharacterized protein